MLAVDVGLSAGVDDSSMGRIDYQYGAEREDNPWYPQHSILRLQRGLASHGYFFSRRNLRDSRAHQFAHF
jgi:hypothetical protein